MEQPNSVAVPRGGRGRRRPNFALTPDEPDYAWVHTALTELRRLPAGTPEHRRLRGRIIEECLPLAERIARRYDRKGESHDDLVQVARIGLLNAVNRFDPAVGSEFLAFAIPTMIGEVKRYFRDCGWSVAVPRRLKDLYPAIGPSVAELSQQLGRAPTPSEIATAIGVDCVDVVETMTAAEGFKSRSIDARPSHDDDGVALIDRMGGVDPGLDFIEDRDALRVYLAELPEREYRIIVMRFFEVLTQSEIAERLGISQMHVSRLLARSLRTLRDGMADSQSA